MTGKLIVCFTHFDGVKGDNLRNVNAKKQHVYRSLQNAISSVREVLGRSAENALSRTVADRVFFVSNIQEPIKESAKKTLDELQRMVETIRATIIPPPPTEVRPIYDVTNLILCIPQAMAAFRDPWRAKLRLPSRSNVSPEHWTRIKALSRRFAERGTYRTAQKMPGRRMNSAMNSSKSWFMFIRRLVWRIEQEGEGFGAAGTGTGKGRRMKAEG